MKIFPNRIITAEEKDEDPLLTEVMVEFRNNLRDSCEQSLSGYLYLFETPTLAEAKLKPVINSGVTLEYTDVAGGTMYRIPESQKGKMGHSTRDECLLSFGNSYSGVPMRPISFYRNYMDLPLLIAGAAWNTYIEKPGSRIPLSEKPDSSPGSSW